MFLEKVEAVVQTLIIDKCLLQEAFLQFYRNTHETVYLFIYLFIYLFVYLFIYFHYGQKFTLLNRFRKDRLKTIKRALI